MSASLASPPGRAALRRPTLSARSAQRLVRFAPQLLLLLLVIVLLAMKPSTLSLGNIQDTVTNAAPIATLALGAMWVLVSGGLDLSPGWGVAMCAMVLGSELQHGMALAPALAVTLLAGGVLGMVNATLIALLGMPPFIATLATFACAEGATLILGNVGTVLISSQVLTDIGINHVLGIPAIALCALAFAAVVGFLARYTRFGLRTYSLGSSREATVARGIPIVRQTGLIYILSGLMTALTGILLVAHTQVVDPDIADLSMLLDAFAATILGGTSLFGGRGTVLGTLTGALIISLMNTSLITLGVGPQNIEFLMGVMILVAVAVDACVRALERKETAIELATETVESAT